MSSNRNSLRVVWGIGLAALIAILANPAFAQMSLDRLRPPTPDRGPRATSVEYAEFRIVLSSSGSVSVHPGFNDLTLRLPEGSTFPVDFTEASEGLLKSGSVGQPSDGIVEVRLDYGRGVLDQISYDDRAMTIKLRSRYAAEASGGPAGNRYTLGPDDKLLINVHNHPELETKLAVSQEGTVTAPFVGDVPAAGLTPTELAEIIAAELGRSYLKDPQVDVQIEEYRSKWVMVNGEVRNPGRVFLTGGTRLKEALADAAGFIETSGEEILISRAQQGTDEFETVSIDRKAFEDGLVDPLVNPGDIITVKGVEWAFIQGEVRAPTRVRVERDSTLLKAISLAQGLTDWADRKTVRVLDGKGNPPRIFNVKAIQNGKMPDPPLKGGDIIVVERRFF